MSRGIVIGRQALQMATCRVCNRPAPMEATWHGLLCEECWNKASAEKNWLSEPCFAVQTLEGLVIVPHRAALQMLLAPDVNGRGADLNSFVRTLLRVRWEREQLRAEAAPGSVSYVPRCCYCDEREHEESLVAIEAEDGLPAIWHCRDARQCDARVAGGIALQMQQGGQRRH